MLGQLHKVLSDAEAMDIKRAVVNQKKRPLESESDISSPYDQYA